MDSRPGLVPADERPLVRATAQRLYRHACAAGRPAWLAPELSRRLCYLVAAIAPELPDHHLSLLVRYAEWTILLDDRLDHPAVDPAMLRALQESVASVIEGGPPPPDPVAALLAGILADLSGLDAAGFRYQRFCQALREAVDSGVDHTLLGYAVVHGQSPWPTAEQYLDMAAQSVNYRSFAHALLIVAASPLPQAVLQRLDRGLCHAARAVRLANDRASYARDRAEARLNILDLRTGNGAQVTARCLEHQLARHIRAHDDLLAAITGPGLAGPVRLLRRCLQISTDLYRQADLR